jgi:Ni/Fe-hydrogenase subunit HybB-like protein
MRRGSKALGRIKDVFWAVAAAGLVAGVGRFAFGLGASTNMMDALPWGWWKVFNMVAGAALATSGFVVAAIIYILQIDRYRPIARVSVLVGFLGYGSSLVALLFDIGLPHRGWHPFFMWNPHSFLFEVFWCVSVYWGVTALELLPIVTERLPLKKVTHWLHEKMLPFVVLGVTLSTMHHSSLGSLFMASPTRLHPLWHSLLIPPEFFLSAMGAGCSAILLLSITTNWLYRREHDMQTLRGLAKASAIFLGLYLVLKSVDFTLNDKWVFIIGPSSTWESVVFLVEISIQALIPVLVLALPSVRRTIPGILVGASFAFFGLIMHRIDTGIVGYFRSSDAVYIPSISEFVLSFGVLAAAGLFYFFLIEKFHVLDAPDDHHDGEKAEAHAEPEVTPWTRQELEALLTGPGAQRVARNLIIFVPLTILALRDQATGAFHPIEQPVAGAVLAGDAMRTILHLDANRNGMVTAFGHEKHKVEFKKVYAIEEKATCAKCHHLDLPRDNNTSCRRCHRDMELDTPLFDFERHKDRFASDEEAEAFLTVDMNNPVAVYEVCVQCHGGTETEALASTREGEARGKEPERAGEIAAAAAKLASARPKPVVDTAVEVPTFTAPKPKPLMRGLASYARKGFTGVAPGFKHAMHGSCLTCHRLREQQRKEDPANPKSRGNCLFCHRDWADEGLFREEEEKARLEAEAERLDQSKSKRKRLQRGGPGPAEPETAMATEPH